MFPGVPPVLNRDTLYANFTGSEKIQMKKTCNA